MITAVAMSGGVDSSVAAAILKNKGHAAVGFTMQLWNQRRRLDQEHDPLPSRCCSLDDVYDARAVAEQLQIPFYVINLEDEFERAGPPGRCGEGCDRALCAGGIQRGVGEIHAKEGV